MFVTFASSLALAEEVEVFKEEALTYCSVGWGWPGVIEMEPGPHCTQEEASASDANVPGGHEVHSSAAPPAKLPGAHAMHVDCCGNG